MMTDELAPDEAIRIALRTEQSCRSVLRILHNKITNPTLQRQYAVLINEETRHERVLRDRYKEIADPSGPLSLDAPRERANLSDMTVEQLLELVAGRQERVIDTYEAVASRISDSHTKALLLELSSIKLFHKSKVLTDLQLIRNYPDYY